MLRNHYLQGNVAQRFQRLPQWLAPLLLSAVRKDLSPIWLRSPARCVTQLYAPPPAVQPQWGDSKCQCLQMHCCFPSLTRVLAHTRTHTHNTCMCLSPLPRVAPPYLLTPLHCPFSSSWHTCIHWGMGCPLALIQLRESLAARAKARPGGAVSEALSCVGSLAAALHLSWQPFAQQLLEYMMLTGPSQVRQMCANLL